MVTVRSTATQTSLTKQTYFLNVFFDSLKYKNLFQKYVAATKGGYNNVRVGSKRPPPPGSVPLSNPSLSVKTPHLANSFKKVFFAKRNPYRTPPVNTKNA